MTSYLNSKYSISKSPQLKSPAAPPSSVIGFSNGWGESNCFLNAALQVL